MSDPQPIGDLLRSRAAAIPSSALGTSVQVGVGTTAAVPAAVKTGAWLDEQQLPALRYSVPGVIPEGFTLLVGPPKAGKSWLVLAVVLGLAAGTHALGIPLTRRPVLYLALEDGDRRLQDRCRKLLDGGPIPEAFHYVTDVPPDGCMATVRGWLDQYGERQPLVVIDTLGRVMPSANAGESAYQRDYRVGSTIKGLADEHPGSGLLVTHHDRKAGGEDFIDHVSGTHGLAGSADTVCVLARKRHETEGLLAVTGRDVEEGEYAIEFQEGCRWELAGRTLEIARSRADALRSAVGLGDRSTAIVEYVELHPEGVTPSAVAKALGVPDANTYLSRLTRSGRVARSGRGTYVPNTNPAA